MRIDVPTFGHELLLDQKLITGRLDGRFTSPNPDDDRFFYDPASAAILPPYTSAFNNYLRTELNYKIDMPYRVFAYDEPVFQKWDWGNAEEGFPSTAGGSALSHDQESVYESSGDGGLLRFGHSLCRRQLDHGSPESRRASIRQSISYATYNAGHMVYIDRAEHDKMKKGPGGLYGEVPEVSGQALQL